MPRKGVKCPVSWSFLNENIEDVEQVSLQPEIQQLLGCSINQDVFLEYPFAYVPAEIVKRLSNKYQSPFEKYKYTLELYKDSTILIGYASKELTCDKFVICLSEEARDKMVKRNRDVTMRILDYVRMKVEKIPRPWKSMGTEDDLDSAFLKNARPYYEVEISLTDCLLRENRELEDRAVDDVRDGYVKLVPQYEVFENVKMNLICKAVQTNLISRENSVQTYPGYPKNQWTQYEYNCFPRAESPKIEENVDNVDGEEKGEIEENEKNTNKESLQVDEGSELREEEKLKKASSLEIFLGDHIEEVVDVIRYNTVINLHTDDISNLAQGVAQESRHVNLITYKENVSLINLSFSKKRIISNISWHSTLNDVVAICYAKGQDTLESQAKQIKNNFNNDTDNASDIQININQDATYDKKNTYQKNRDTQDTGNEVIEDDHEKKNLVNEVLIWSSLHPLYPKMILASQDTIEVVSFCPYKPDVLVGGSSSGQIVIWDLRDLLDFEETCSKIPIINPVVLSNEETSHSLPIRDIHWLPSWYEVRIDGSLQKSLGKSLQFATASDDGSLAIWDLRWQLNSRPASKTRKTDILESFDPKRLDGILRPLYQLVLQLPKESWTFSPTRICLPFVKDENRGTKDLDARTNELLKRFLVATAEGEIISCSWEGQEFETESSSLERCNFLSRSSVHDGPVLGISRCSFLEDVLLTIGGKIFAIWKDDYLDSPLLWRRGCCSYTSCCWSSRAGIFLLARFDGELEVWEITRKTQEPIFVQFISTGPLTGLYSRLSSKILGVCDHNGAFRIFAEPEESDEESLERIEWFEEFVWREVKRKRNFCAWQSDFLKMNPRAIERKKTRAADEAKRKHQEAREKFQKEQEELARLEAENKARMIKKPKDAIWKSRDHERMKKILLKKKGFDPIKIEESRLPLVLQQKDRNLKLNKAKQEILLKEKYFRDLLCMELPFVERKDKSDGTNVPVIKGIEKGVKKYKEDFSKIKTEVRRKLNETSFAPKFDWNSAIREGRRRQLLVKID